MKSNKLSLIIGLLGIAGLSYAMKEPDLVKLPDAVTLKRRFNTEELQYFLENTQLHKTLDKLELDPIHVEQIVELELGNWSEYLKNNNMTPIPAIMPRHLKPRIILKILEDYPGAIQDLQEKGFLKSNF